jgi:hypothetical protein
MLESIEVFDQIANNVFFKEKSIVLFLNKNDLFEEKYKTSPITTCFASFQGELE